MIKESLKIMTECWRNPKNICSLLLVVYSTAAFAQTKPDPKKPAPVFTAIRQPSGVADIREKLVQLALQNPNYEIADRKVAIATYQVKRAKGSWLNVAAVQGNLNEFVFKGSTVSSNGVVSNPAAFFPKYNFGVSLPFSFISERKNDIKVAKENLAITQAEKNQRFREIKVQVLSKYEDYLLVQQKLDFQSQITQDARTAYLAAEKDFQEGSIKQDDYNRSYRGYTDEKVKQFEYQHDFNIAKLELEAMIGISIDDLLKK